MEKTSKKKWSEKTFKEKMIGAVSTIVLMVIVILVIRLILPTDHDDYADMTKVLKKVSNEFVTDQLKYPDEWEWVEDQRIDRLDDTTYSVSGVLLAKNGFGVRGRYYYYAQLKFIAPKNSSYNYPENKDYWSVLSYEFTPD